MVRHVLPEPEAAAILLKITMLSLVPWLLIFGLTGLFIRYLNRPIPLIRYISDASYWIYLVHPPVLIWLVWLLAPVPISAVSSFILLLLIATPILFLSYHYGVRSTFIGEFLNGRRYSRPIPNRSTAEEAIALTRT
jgi:membrane-bound acyltransferase YfiQ involved in biofilm formation